MPFSGDTYALPAGSLAANGSMSNGPTQHNAPLQDIEGALSSVKASASAAQASGAAASAAIASHSGAADPHAQYLNSSRGDSRYSSSVATRAALAALDATGLQRVLVRGHSTEGIGSGWYKQLGVAPSPVKAWHVQSSDGGWWELVSEQDLNPYMFGAVCDGVADDTLAVLHAFEFAESFGRELIVHGEPRLVAATVPAGAVRIAGSGGDYVRCPALRGVNGARLLIEGNIGLLNTSSTTRGLVDLTISISDRQMTESSAENSTTYVYCATGSAKSALYSNLAFEAAVTDVASGAWRTRGFIFDDGAASVSIENVRGENAVGAVTVFNAGNVVCSKVTVTNTQTAINLNTVGTYVVSDIILKNTKSQADKWVARTHASLRRWNGMDCVLVEGGQSGIIRNLRSEWAIERCIYAQGGRVSIANCHALNSDGFKACGNSYTSLVSQVDIASCSVLLDETFAATNGRNAYCFFSSYWSNNISIDGGTFVNKVPSRTVVRAAVLLGGQRDGSSHDNVSLIGFTAVGARALVQGDLCTLTAAALAALSPAGSFLVVTNLRISKCQIEQNDVRELGVLYYPYTVGASADALNNVAFDRVMLDDNTVVLPATATNRADFLFWPRWSSNVSCKGSLVNLPFVNGLFLAAMPSPYSNIFIDERDLKYAGDAGVLLNLFPNINLMKGSRLDFSIDYGTISGSLSSTLHSAGAASAGAIEINLAGLGYAAVSTTSNDFSIWMQASGNFYAGKIVGGTITNQISTPPITLTNGGGILNVRGDLAPTIPWNVTLNKI